MIEYLIITPSAPHKLGMKTGEGEGKTRWKTEKQNMKRLNGFGSFFSLWVAVFIWNWQ